MLDETNPLFLGEPETVFVAAGSNIAPEWNIPRALELLRRRVRIKAVSTFYRTPALAAQPGAAGANAPFINGVVSLETTLAARTLKFDVLRQIEAQLGRVRTADKYAARTIDLDLVIYGAHVLNEPDLRCPDPDIRVRNFIALPLAELAPDLVLPDTHQLLLALPPARDRTGMEECVAFSAALRSLVRG